MGDHRAIAAVCEAVVALLRAEAAEEDFGQDVRFQVYSTHDFQQPMAAGVSLLLYRIVHDGVQRRLQPPPDPLGRRRGPLLSLNLHLLLTAWAPEASLQNTLAGWVLRVLEDHPVLTAPLLNGAFERPVFEPEESVEIVPADLPTEDLFQIWDTLIQNVYQLSVPLVARTVRIESRRRPEQGEPVRERELGFGPLATGE